MHTYICAYIHMYAYRYASCMFMSLCVVCWSVCIMLYRFQAIPCEYAVWTSLDVTKHMERSHAHTANLSESLKVITLANAS